MATIKTPDEAERVLVRTIATVEIVFFAYMLGQSWLFTGVLTAAIFILAALHWVKRYDPTASYGEKLCFFAHWAFVQSTAVPIGMVIEKWQTVGSPFDATGWRIIAYLTAVYFALLWLVKFGAVPILRFILRHFARKP
jgi:hypothetical protein